ncbi:MAG: bifunctional 4-hydroxy-2-oxoglutarate aldolase/2-dehydro-3-deoxy-phosphogluconate aldolase [Christensenellales bacterium]
MDNVLKKIGDMGLVPVVVIEDADLAVPAAKALIDGGLDVMEITMRTEQGIAAIEKVKKAYPDMLVGAGTVLTVEKAKEAVGAGAEFIVAPGFNPDMVQWCMDKNIAITPGCVTPTEIEQALKAGLNTLKFFPANIYGGIDGCKALNGPYRMVKFIPTGGVSLSNLSDFTDKPFIHAIGGGWLCKTADIKAQNFEAITKVVKESINVLLGFEMAHIGINVQNADESLKTAGRFADGFGFSVKQGNSSNFVGSGIEVNKAAGLGANGHIAIRTSSIARAVYYLGKRGYCVDWSTSKGPEQRPVAVYLKDEIGGFAIHLLQK